MSYIILYMLNIYSISPAAIWQKLRPSPGSMMRILESIYFSYINTHKVYLLFFFSKFSPQRKNSNTQKANNNISRAVNKLKLRIF